MTEFTKIQIRNGTFQEWYDANPMLAMGEPGFESDTGRFKIGDGINHWNDLLYMSCCFNGVTPTPVVPTPTPTATLEVNTMFVLWEDCYDSSENAPNQFGCFDLCAGEEVCKSVEYYFQNNFSDENSIGSDFVPYNNNYSFICDVVDGNNTMVLKVEKGNGISLDFNKQPNICYCTPTPTSTPII